jgi:PAS domain S-box-containing protein
VKFVHVLSRVLEDAAGNLEIVGALMDVTENTRLYRDLAEREAKIRRLVDANIIGVFIGDINGRILEANDAFLRIVGYDCEDVMAGRINWKDLTPQDWRDRDAQWIEEHERTGVRLPIGKEYFRKDGSRVPVLVGAANFEGGNQGVAFVLDLTERKKAEDQLRLSEGRLAEAQRLSHSGVAARRWILEQPERWVVLPIVNDSDFHRVLSSSKSRERSPNSDLSAGCCAPLRRRLGEWLKSAP